MEQAIRHLAGRSFKLFLKNQTAHPAKAIIAGLLVTAVLQSSSIVNLLVLAFVGARILSLRNAMAVILGSNLGSTVYNWIVVFLGFKFDIQSFAFPIMALGAIGLVFFQENKRVMHWTRMLFGVSLLFLGLSNIKGGIETLVNTVDLTGFNEYGNIAFVIVGFIITTIVQSSATTVVITLSALNAGALTFESAACLVIGSEVGTSMKTIIGSLGTIPDKKRVALGNFLQNVSSSAVAFILLSPIIYFIQEWVGIKDPLIALVSFQSMINLIGILIFYPLLPLFSSWLEKQYGRENNKLTVYLNILLLNDPEEAINCIEKEGKRLIYNIIILNRQGLEITPHHPDGNVPLEFKTPNSETTSYSVRYEVVKHLNGEIIDFCLKLLQKDMDEIHKNRLIAIMKLLQETTSSSKSVKDIRHNIKDFRDSADDTLHELYLKIRKSEDPFYTGLFDILITDNSKVEQDLIKLQIESKSRYEDNIREIYKLSNSKKIQEVELATLINVYGEIQSSHELLISAVVMLLKAEKIYD